MCALLSGILCSLATAVMWAETVELKDGTVYSGKITTDLGAKIGLMTDDGKFVLIEKSKIKKPSTEKEALENGKEDEANDEANAKEEEDAAPSASTPEPDDVEAKAARRLRATSHLKGHPSKEFTAKDLAGKEISLSDYRGKVVLLVFWATWCYPCVQELPNEKKAFEKYNDKGFTIISVSQDLNRQKLESFVKQHGLEWTQIQDSSGKKGEISKLYSVWGIPQSYLIDRDGIIRFRNVRGEKLEKAVATLLGIPAVD